MAFEIKSNDPQTTKQIAHTLMKLLPQGSVVLLEGDLGSGKTTFTKGVGEALGIQRAVKSPTYTIIKEYPLSTDGLLVHMDAYRLEEGGEDTVDVLYYLSKDNYLFIEWSQFIKDSIPKEHLTIHFIPQQAINERIIRFEPCGKIYEKIIDQLKEQWV